MNNSIIANNIKSKALEIGFSLIGFCDANPLYDEGRKLVLWISKGYNAQMDWFEKSIEKRINPSLILNDAKTVIVVGLNYYNSIKYSNRKIFGKISKYALGKDYHFVIKEKLNQLIEFIKKYYPDGTFLPYSDTGPLMEKVLAQKAGVGWIGKNTNLINKRIGSFFFLGCIITNINLPKDTQYLNYCGSCTKCIEACPTNAIVEPFVLDSNKCISYLTIEYKGEQLPEDLKGKFNNWVFGCDICQDVCPWNRFAKKTEVPEFLKMNEPEIPLLEILKISKDEFNSIYKNTAVKRTKHSGFMRNIKFLIE